MPELTIDDVLDLDYPDAPEWNADGTYLALTVHADDGQRLRVVSADAPTDQ